MQEQQKQATPPPQQGAFAIEHAAQRIGEIMGAKEPPKSEPKTSSKPTVDQKKEEAPKATPSLPEKPDGKEVQEVEAKTEEEIPSDEPAQEIDAEEEGRSLPTSIEDLADALGVDVEHLQQMQVKAKIDGMEKPVTLKELVKSFQLEGHLNNQSMRLAEERKRLEESIAQTNAHQQQVAQHMQDMTAMVEVLESELLRDFNGVNWRELRETDAAEYSARWLEYQQRRQNIDQARQQIRFEMQRVHDDNVKKQQEHFQQYIIQQQQALLDKLPAWKDETVRKKEEAELATFLSREGFSADELKNLLDHRYYLIARKAWMYDQMQKQKPSKNQLKELPQFIKPSARKTQGEVDSARIDEIRQRLKKTGSLEDAVQLLNLRKK